MLCWHFCFSDIFKHRLISLTNSPPTTSTSVVQPSSILRKVQNNIFLLFKPTPLLRRLIPRTIGRILFRHKFPLHGANLANFIVSHFPRIYSLIQDVGRGQIILTLAIVPRLQSLRRWIWPEKYVHLIRSRWKDIILVELEKFSVLLFPISNGALQRISMKNMKKLWRWWLLGWWVYST